MAQSLLRTEPDTGSSGGWYDRADAATAPADPWSLDATGASTDATGASAAVPAERLSRRVVMPGDGIDADAARRLLDRSLIAWSPRLDVGIPWIDDQHRQLFDLHRGLVRSLSDEPCASRFRNGFMHLCAHVQEHFADEEAFMAGRGCSDLVPHAAEHRRLLRDAEDFAFTIGRVFGPAECIAVARYLRLWLLRHITGADARLGRCEGSPET